MPSKRRIGVVLASLSLVALAAASVALADLTEITDGSKTRGPLDIRRTSADHASSAKLLHTIVTHGRIPLTRRANFCIRIYFRSDASLPDRFICSNPRESEAHITSFSGGQERGHGFVRVLRPSENSIAFRFRISSAIGGRSVYYWAVDSFYNPSRGQCSSAAGCTDSAPNGNRKVRHFVGTREPGFTG
jgi:hypothetical protein